MDPEFAERMNTDLQSKVVGQQKKINSLRAQLAEARAELTTVREENEKLTLEDNYQAAQIVNIGSELSRVVLELAEIKATAAEAVKAAYKEGGIDGYHWSEYWEVSKARKASLALKSSTPLHLNPCASCSVIDRAYTLLAAYHSATTCVEHFEALEAAVRGIEAMLATKGGTDENS